jgi:hypothetical protein
MSYRVLVCTSCREYVGVHEIPDRWIDPDLYLCGTCHTPVPDGHQMPLEPPEHTPRYDPAQAEIPF